MQQNFNAQNKKEIHHKTQEELNVIKNKVKLHPLITHRLFKTRWRFSAPNSFLLSKQPSYLQVTAISAFCCVMGGRIRTALPSPNTHAVLSSTNNNIHTNLGNYWTNKTCHFFDHSERVRHQMKTHTHPRNKSAPLLLIFHCEGFRMNSKYTQMSWLNTP